MLARFYAAYQKLAGADCFKIFDTDHPEGGLYHLYPEYSEIIDLERTTGQVKLFDTMMAQAGTNFIVDLQSNHLHRFFDIFHDIEYDEGAKEAGVGIVVFYMLDRSAQSLNAARKMQMRLRKCEFVLVKNHAIGTEFGAEMFPRQEGTLKPHREIVLPQFSWGLLELLENPEFDLTGFIAGQGRDLPYEIQQELWGILEMLYDQRAPDREGVIHLL